MKTTAKAIQAILATIAGFILLSSPHTQQLADPGDRSFPVVMGILVFLSVAFLHWALVRYITGADLLATAERSRLHSAGETGYQRGFFRGTVGIGFLFVAGYSADLMGFGFHAVSSLGYFFVGIVFLFLGVVARARGVVISLLESRNERPQRIAS